jgi:D-alanyl-lipoteichoic acid acyltransferase DltB (MBOAT superfamily)
MLFNTVQFFVFLAIVLVVFYAAPRALRRLILLVASYVFYLSWNYKFVVLLLGLTIVDFVAAIAIENASRKRLFLWISLAANLGMLGFFKYYNFFADNLAQLLRYPPHSWEYSIILPLGISFHTFQSISYVVDVYRGKQAAIRNPIDYALFISFFPQLVAGPIVRAEEFFADLHAWKHPSGEEVLRGVLLVVLGLTKKMAFADQFAQIADSYFQNLGVHPGGFAAWSGVFAFAMQIFFDFSGYTDMAIGIALLLGFHFPVNFRRPYLAFSITDFWHRWHISLSLWLRDYLYIPLGGNRHGRWMTYRNLMLTMLLGGLWHGASWNFVIWGGYHGGLLSLERMMGRREFEKQPPVWLFPLRAAMTFGFVCVGWVFFRAATFADSRYVLTQLIHSGRQVDALIPKWLMYMTGASLLIALIEEKFEWTERLSRGSIWAYAAFVILLLLTIEMIGVTEKALPFVYFQF